VRSDGRLNEELRPLAIERNYTKYAQGSVLIRSGESHVLCTAMVEDGVPPHCREREMGWLTAEYTMLPGANPERKSLQRAPGGRDREIQRLIGRSLRAGIDLFQIGMRTVWIDCTVLQGDGGTRTTSITGGYVALMDALQWMKESKLIEQVPVKHGVAAISVGVVGGEPMLDLTAEEDRRAEVDMNVVMTHDGEFVELQGTAEQTPFGRERLREMLRLAEGGVEAVKVAQIKALSGGLGT